MGGGGVVLYFIIRFSTHVQINGGEGECQLVVSECTAAKVLPKATAGPRAMNVLLDKEINISFLVGC